MYYGCAVNRDKMNKQNVSSQQSSQVSQLPHRRTDLALVLKVMLNANVEDSPSNRLPTQCQHISQCFIKMQAISMNRY